MLLRGLSKNSSYNCEEKITSFDKGNWHAGGVNDLHVIYQTYRNSVIQYISFKLYFVYLLLDNYLLYCR